MKLRDVSGRWCTQHNQVVDTIVDFYQELFTTSNPTNFEEVTNTIPQLVTQEMNDMLLAKFKMEEVESALRQMAPLKAPGPNGMPPFFTRAIGLFWEVM